MKRIHIHVSVRDLPESVRFYSTLFGTDPAVVKNDYAKWALDDPRVNFAISLGRAPGLDDLGVQAETPDELSAIEGRLAEAERSVLVQKNSACCYARLDKAWVEDPQGVRWETFRTFGTADVLHEEAAAPIAAEPSAGACCTKASA